MLQSLPASHFEADWAACCCDDVRSGVRLGKSCKVATKNERAKTNGLIEVMLNVVKKRLFLSSVKIALNVQSVGPQTAQTVRIVCSVRGAGRALGVVVFLSLTFLFPGSFERILSETLRFLLNLCKKRFRVCCFCFFFFERKTSSGRDLTSLGVWMPEGRLTLSFVWDRQHLCGLCHLFLNIW